MRLFSYTTLFVLIVLTVYLWGKYFTSESENILWIFENKVVIYFLSALFLLYVSIQMYPRDKKDIQTEFNFIIITLLFIPIFVICFSYLYLDTGLKNASDRDEYVYFSVITFTTLGYGDILPEKEARMFASLQAIIGFIFVPLLISQFVNVVRDIRAERPQRRVEDDPRIKEIIGRED